MDGLPEGAKSQVRGDAWRVVCYKDGATVFAADAWGDVKVGLRSTVFRDIEGKENSFPGRDCSKTALTLQQKVSRARSIYGR